MRITTAFRALVPACIALQLTAACATTPEATTLSQQDTPPTMDIALADFSPTGLRAAGRQVRATFYWEKKDLATYLYLMKSLVHTALQQKPNDRDLARAYRRTAMGAAYDIASMSWPGWAEPGITPTPAQVELGLEAARLNVALGLELELGPEVLRNGQFILGAQLLAAGDHAGAADAFSNYQRLTAAAELPGTDIAAAWVLLARLGTNTDTNEPRRALAVALDTLRGGGDEASAQADSIAAARAVFFPEQASR